MDFINRSTEKDSKDVKFFKIKKNFFVSQNSEKTFTYNPKH